MSCYIYQLPSWVLDDLCRNMDTLSEWDWNHFGEWAPSDPARAGLEAPSWPVWWVLIRGALRAAIWTRVSLSARRQATDPSRDPVRSSGRRFVIFEVPCCHSVLRQVMTADCALYGQACKSCEQLL